MGRAGFAEPGEDVVDAVVVRLGAAVRHGVDGKCHVETLLIGLSSCCLDARTGRDAGRGGSSYFVAVAPCGPARHR